MLAVRLGLAVIMAAACGLAASLDRLGLPPAVSGGAFGGPVPVHIARVGHIEVDLEPAAPDALERTGCAGAPPGTTCFTDSGSVRAGGRARRAAIVAAPLERAALAP